MYDYVMMLCFDDATEARIKKLILKLGNFGLPASRKPWPPHITIALFKGIEISELIKQSDELFADSTSFPISFTSFNDFHQRVFYLQPQTSNDLLAIYSKTIAKLGNYFYQQKQPIFTPHVTLGIWAEVRTAKEILKDECTVFAGNVASLRIYSRQVVLQKCYNFT